MVVVNSSLVLLSILSLTVFGASSSFPPLHTAIHSPSDDDSTFGIPLYSSVSPSLWSKEFVCPGFYLAQRSLFQQQGQFLQKMAPTSIFMFNSSFTETSLEFTNSKNIMVVGLTSLDSQMFHIVIYQCQHVKVQGVKVVAAANSPNTDGIHIAGSDDVTILNSNIRTGDDCVSVGASTTNLWVENVACGPGHGIRYSRKWNLESELIAKCKGERVFFEKELAHIEALSPMNLGTIVKLSKKLLGIGRRSSGLD